MLRRVLLLILVALSPSLALAADKPWQGLYRGTIGTARVLVMLGPADGSGEVSRYTYAARPFDLGLVIEKDGLELTLVETKKVGAEPNDLKGKGRALITGRWTLSPGKDGMTGTWKDPKGEKSLPIALSRVQSGGREEKYGDLWARDLAFDQPQKMKTFGNVTVGLAKDKVFKVDYPRLTSHPDAARMERINALLEAEHRMAVIEARECLEYKPRDRPEDMKPGESIASQVNLEVTYATPTLLSFTESGSIFCGGAYPNNYIRSSNIDLATITRIGSRSEGEGYKPVLAPAEIGRIFDISTKAKLTAFNTFWWNRWERAANAAKEKSDDCIEGSQQSQPMAERSADFGFRPTGLVVRRTDYAHASSACLETDYNPIVIRWNDLKPFLKTGQAVLTSEVR